MSRRQAVKLLLDVICYTRELAKNGVTLFGVGELGMANTTPAAAIVSTITGRAPEEVVGIHARTCRQINWLIKLMLLCAGRLR